MTEFSLCRRFKTQLPSSFDCLLAQIEPGQKDSGITMKACGAVLSAIERGATGQGQAEEVGSQDGEQRETGRVGLSKAEN